MEKGGGVVMDHTPFMLDIVVARILLGGEEGVYRVKGQVIG